VHLAEGVTADDEGNGLFVVHGHAAERLADVTTGSDRVGIRVRTFRVHVDEAHLDGAERLHEVAVAAVALVVEPDVLGSPVDVLLGSPHIFTTASETEGLEAHRFEGDVAGEDQKIGPRELAAVLLLDRLEQEAGLVEIDVVGPAVERGEALGARSATAATIVGAVGAGRVPGHADEERAVVPIVGRPPVLRVGHERREVSLYRGEIEGLELLGVIEVVAHRVGLGRTLMEDVQVQLVGPPVLVGRAAPSRMIVVQDWTLVV